MIYSKNKIAITVYVILSVLLAILLTPVFVGCSAPSVALLEYRECRSVETAMFYDQCRFAYEAHGYIWFQDSKGPVRRDKEGRPINDPLTMRQEMALNECHLHRYSACGGKPE